MEMNYDTFVAQHRDLAFFGPSGVQGDRGSHALQLTRWVKSGKLLRLKRGVYTLPIDRRRARFSLPWLANTLYSPSYLSLDFVLSYHDLIPERVHAFTSVTRLKTASFQNALGRFVYRHVKPALFFGFEEVADEYGTRVLMAAPEKALLDLLYLRTAWEPTMNFFADDLRLQQLDQLRASRLAQFVVPYRSKKLSAAVQVLLRRMEHG